MTGCNLRRPVPGEKDHYIRFAYSGIDVSAINEGMEKLKAYFDDPTIDENWRIKIRDKYNLHSDDQSSKRIVDKLEEMQLI